MNIDSGLDCLFNITDIKAERVAISSPVQMCVIPHRNILSFVWKEVDLMSSADIF